MSAADDLPPGGDPEEPLGTELAPATEPARAGGQAHAREPAAVREPAQATDQAHASEPAQATDQPHASEPPRGTDQAQASEPTPAPEPAPASEESELAGAPGPWGREEPEDIGAADEGATGAAARTAEARLARVHLRTGSYGLARAELESMAGAGILDAEALADLAEVRWRTGDLPGAGEAAQAYLATGRETATSLAIAAEAAAVLGRPGEARRLATRAIAATDGPIDDLFLGIARSPVWPSEARQGEPAAELFPAGAAAPRGKAAAGAGAIVTRRMRGGAAGGGPSPAVVAELPWATASATPAGSTPAVAEPPGPALSVVGGAALAAEAGLWDDHEIPVVAEPLPDPADELVAARAALAADDHEQAALHLALALRLDPTMAPAVLEAAAHHRSPALEMVRGDALRLVGHEVEARRAYGAAARAVAKRAEQRRP